MISSNQRYRLICERIIPNHELLNQHLVAVHSIDNTATCAVCNEVYMSKTELDSHVDAKQTRPNPDPLLYSINCYPCDEHFNAQSIIKEHIVIPTTLVTWLVITFKQLMVYGFMLVISVTQLLQPSLLLSPSVTRTSSSCLTCVNRAPVEPHYKT